MRTRLLALLLVACSADPKPEDDTAGPGIDGDADTDADGDADADVDTDVDTTPCVATLVSVLPADQAVDVPADTTVVAAYDVPVTAEDITIGLRTTSEAGEDLPGTVTVAADGLSATLTPDAELARDSEYEVLVSVCDVPSASHFTTVGEAETLDIAGRTYDVDLTDNSDLDWVTPASGALLLSQVQTNHLLFMVESAGAEIDMLGAAGLEEGRDVVQYQCAPVVDFPAATFEANPFFAIGPVDAAINAEGIAVPLYGLAVTGVVAADGASLETVVLVGVLDIGPVSVLLGYDACELVESLGDTCVACPNGDDTCLVMEVRDERAVWIEGLEIDPDFVPAEDC